MTNILKLAATSAIALSLAACASSTDDKYQVGVNDSDSYSTGTDADVELSDEQQFGMNDDDNFEATTSTSMEPKAVAGRMVKSDKTIFAGTMGADNYTTVRGAIEANGLNTMLDDDTAAYTVFAPSNDSFAGLDLTKVSAADQKALLAGHVVSGRISAADLGMKLDQNNGSYSVRTAGGQDLRFFRSGDKIKVSDYNGYTYDIDAADMEFSNGYVHGITGVLGRTY